MADQSENAPRLKPDELVERLMPDPSHVPDARVLVGFLGRSAREGYWRLYSTPTLNEYVEFAEDDVVHSHAFENDDNRLGGTAVWVKREANLQHTRTVSREAQADFLQGSIMASALGRGRFGRSRPGPCYVQQIPMQHAVFLSFEGHYNSCVTDICNIIFAPSYEISDLACPLNSWHPDCA